MGFELGQRKLRDADPLEGCDGSRQDVGRRVFDEAWRTTSIRGIRRAILRHFCCNDIAHSQVPGLFTFRE